MRKTELQSAKPNDLGTEKVKSNLVPHSREMHRPG